MISNYATNIALVNKALLKVENIIWGNVYNVEQFETFGVKPVVVNDLAVQKGDDYDEASDKFYHEGVEVKNIHDFYNDQINSLNSDLDAIEEMLYYAEGGIPVNEENS